MFCKIENSISDLMRTLTFCAIRHKSTRTAVGQQSRVWDRIVFVFKTQIAMKKIIQSVLLRQNRCHKEDL